MSESCQRLVWSSSAEIIGCINFEGANQKFHFLMYRGAPLPQSFAWSVTRGVARNLFWGDIKFPYSLCFTIRNMKIFIICADVIITP